MLVFLWFTVVELGPRTSPLTVSWLAISEPICLKESGCRSSVLHVTFSHAVPALASPPHPFPLPFQLDQALGIEKRLASKKPRIDLSASKNADPTIPQNPLILRDFLSAASPSHSPSVRRKHLQGSCSAAACAASTAQGRCLTRRDRSASRPASSTRC